MYNLQIYPINVRNGKLDRELPGLIALQAPRKAARGREADQVVLLVGLTGGDVLTAEAFGEWLRKKGDVYFQTSGSVTSAMRSLAEAVNSDLLDRNLKKAAGGQVNGSLCLAVIRKDIIYSLVIGGAKLFIIQDEETAVQLDSDNHPRGLGMNQSLNCRFSQTIVKDKAQLLISTKPSPAWTVDSLAGSTKISIDALGRRLFNQMPAEMSGALVRLSIGKGVVEFLGFPLQERVMETGTAEQESTPSIESLPVEEEMTPTILPVDLGETSLQPLTDDLSEPQPPVQTPQEEPVGPATSDRRVRPVSSPKPPRSSRGEEMKVKVGRAAQGLTEFNSKSGNWFRKFVHKVLPGQSENPMELPRSLLIIIAILVPLIVVAFASSVYMKKGKTQQFEENFQQGIIYAQKAEELREILQPGWRTCNNPFSSLKKPRFTDPLRMPWHCLNRSRNNWIHCRGSCE